MYREGGECRVGDKAEVLTRQRRVLVASIAAVLTITCSLLILFFVLWPRAVAECSPAAVEEGVGLVRCNGNGSKGFSIQEYAWDFGDGSTASGVAVDHTYADGPNVYSVRLTITDVFGGKDSDTTSVTVINQPPNADCGGPYTCQPGQEIQLTGSCSDPSPVDAASLNVRWTDSNGQVINYPTYRCPDTGGAVIVTLTCTDKDGASDEACCPVQIATPVPQVPPTAVIVVSEVPKSQKCYRFDGSQSTDPDGQIVSYDWDMGDGATRNGITVDYCYTHPGHYTVRLTVTDNDGLTGAAEEQVGPAAMWGKH